MLIKDSLHKKVLHMYAHHNKPFLGNRNRKDHEGSLFHQTIQVYYDLENMVN